MSKFANESNVVVITGASSGIGLCLSNFYANNGFIVVNIARHNRQNQSNFYQCDVSDEQQVKDTFYQIKQKFGKINLLINNAGFGLSGAVELCDLSSAKQIFDVNFFGAFNCYKYALPLMESGSKIINISSVCAFFPLPFRAFYCASKSALNLLFYSARMECKDLKIQICNVCPGDTKTNFTKNRVKNFNTNSRYNDKILNATNKIDANENNRMSADFVAKKIYKLSLKRKLPPHKIIGFKYKFLYFIMRFMPLSVLLHFTEKFFGGHNKGRNN